MAKATVTMKIEQLPQFAELLAAAANVTHLNSYDLPGMKRLAEAVLTIMYEPHAKN